MTVNYITEAVEAVIGAETEATEATHPVEASEVRRFCHAIMDASPDYWDPGSIAAQQSGATVAPPAFPTHMFRRSEVDPDPLERIDEPDFDGISRSFNGLPPVKVALPRLVNGGYEYEFFRHARLGERVFRKSRYKDIHQRDGRAGPMVLVVIEETYSTESGEVLLKVTNTQILR